jgi:hypothetical protein
MVTEATRETVTTVTTTRTTVAVESSSAMDVDVDATGDDGRRSRGRIRIRRRPGTVTGTIGTPKGTPTVKVSGTARETTWSSSSSVSPRSSLLGDALRKSAREDALRRSESDESETAAFAEAFAAERGTSGVESVEEVFARAFARDDGDDGCESRHCSSTPIDIPRSESGKGHWKTCVDASDARDARRGDG